MPDIIPIRVQKLREKNNITQDGLVKRVARLNGPQDGAALSKRTLQRIENNAEPEMPMKIREATLFALAKALHVDSAVLTGESEMPEGAVDKVPAGGTRSKSISETKFNEYHTRLVQMGDKYAIVEFSQNEPHGKVIANGIEDYEAGMRLANSSLLRQRLYEMVLAATTPDEGFIEFIYEGLDENITGKTDLDRAEEYGADIENNGAKDKWWGYIRQCASLIDSNRAEEVYDELTVCRYRILTDEGIIEVEEFRNRGGLM